MKKKAAKPKSGKSLKTAKEFKKFAGILKGNVIGELRKVKRMEKEF